MRQQEKAEQTLKIDLLQYETKLRLWVEYKVDHHLTEYEAAFMLNVKIDWLRKDRMRVRSLVPYNKIGAKLVRYSVTQLQEYLRTKKN